jgi:hypothetical protein
MGDSIRTRTELTPQNQPALGTRVVYEIPRTADMECLNILFSGSLQLTTGATSLITDGVMNLITAVELLANAGRDVIATIPFAHLCQTNMFRRKYSFSYPIISQPGVGIAVNAFSIAACLDMAAFAAARPKDSNLRENNYESLQLAFRFAPDVSGVYTGGGFVNTTNVLNLAVMVRECVELPDPQTGVYSSPVVRPLITSNDVIVPGAANKVQFKLTPGQGLRGIALKVTTNASPPVFNAALLSRVRVNVGKIVRVDVSGAALIAQNAVDGLGAQTGYLFIDFADRYCSDDMLNDVLDLDPLKTNGADSIIEFDTSAACIISVVQYGYIPLAA